MHEVPRSIGRRLDSLLEILWNERGTDLHLTVGLPPMVRVHGELMAIPGEPVLTATDTEALVEDVLSPEQKRTWEESYEYDFSFSWRENARIRGNAYTQRSATAMALRMIPREIPNPETLGIPPVVRDLALKHQGLILVTGPTGSGKSTTLASLINLINETRGCHIVTIEDPIEYVHDHKKAAVNQREVGTDTESFHNALRAVLREDPDVLLVGEMRDPESIQFALTAAETGHLVFATLHTNDTAQSVSRMIDVFPAEQQEQIRVQLAAALSGVVYQRLIPKIDSGMVAAYEVLVATPPVRNLIKEDKTHQLRNSLLTGARDGMITLEHSLSALIQAGSVSYEEAIARSLFPKDIDRAPRLLAGARA